MGSGQGIGELRLRVEGSFTASELKELARKWGLTTDPAWDRSPSDLARGLLRDAERMFGQSELVRRLRTEKPLVEWPDVDTRDAEKWGPKSVTELGLGPAPAIQGVFDEQTELRATDLGSLELPRANGESSNEDAPKSVAGTLIEPAPPSVGSPTSQGALTLNDAPPPSVAPVSQAAPTSQAEDAPLSAAPSSGVRPQSPFPGTTAPVDARQKTGVDPKILIVVASLMFGLAVVAFAAGLLWSRRATVSTASEGPKPTASINMSGLSGRATQVFDDALLGVATRCEVDVDGPPTSEILASAQEGCGRSVRESRRRIADPDLPSSPDSPRPRPRDSNGTDDNRPVHTPQGSAPTRPSCVSGCAGVHSGCMSSCGAEPSDVSKFDVWQACSGRCLAAESRCRLSCR